MGVRVRSIGCDERTLAGVAAKGAEDFEAAEADGVDEEMPALLEGARRLEVFEQWLFGFRGGRRRVPPAARRAESFSSVVAEAGEGGDAVVGFEGLGGMVRFELPGGAGAEGGVELLAKGFEPFAGSGDRGLRRGCSSRGRRRESSSEHAARVPENVEKFSGGEFAPRDGGQSGDS